MSNHTIKMVGWIGVGDQGGPMAKAVGEAGFALHLWARRPESLEPLKSVSPTIHDSIADLARACDVVCLCLRGDSDLTEVLTKRGLWDNLAKGAAVINHGTGLPKFAIDMAKDGAKRGIGVLDAPVSGGRPAATAKQLTTIVGGDEVTLERLTPVFQVFSKKVVYMGPAGAGQTGKLINNALLMMNQANVQEILRLSQSLSLDITRLVDTLLSGTASSFALQSLSSNVSGANADHLKDLQLIDMDLFHEAMAAAKQNSAEIFNRAVGGAKGLPDAFRLIAASSAKSPPA
jgi:3-hydroxyisobutyrate dehydrogenase-like beta-hydroxyacid dehydrogenase